MEFRRRNPILLLFLFSLMLALAVVIRARSPELGVRDIAGPWPLIVVGLAVMGAFNRIVASSASRLNSVGRGQRSPDFERGSREVGRLGRGYPVGVGLIVLLLPARWLAGPFGFDGDNDLIGPGLLLVLCGTLTIYFGNVLSAVRPAAHSHALMFELARLRSFRIDRLRSGSRCCCIAPNQPSQGKPIP